MFKREKKRNLESSNDVKHLQRKKRKYGPNEQFDAHYQSPKQRKHDFYSNEMKYDSNTTGFSSDYNPIGRQMEKSDTTNSVSESDIKDSVVYYERILQCLKQELPAKDVFAYNSLKESEGKEVKLSCHGTVSHCLELLLTHCQEEDVMQRFMSAFAEQRITVCTSANASHITELLICYAVKAIQNWGEVMNSEDDEKKSAVTFYFTWLTELGEFVLENLNCCLLNTYSCHVICTLIQAFSGDMSKPSEFRSKNSKFHKQELHSQYAEDVEDSAKEGENSVVLEKIPKFFKKFLKGLCKSLIKAENLSDLLLDGSTTTVIEALLCALKKRLPKSCKKTTLKLAEVLFSEKNQDSVPLSLLHRNCSFVVDKMFNSADDDLQVSLWNGYIEVNLAHLVAHPVGHFVVQRMFESISNKSVFEKISESIWCHFDEILKSQNYGIFLSIANACNRLSAQQSNFMKHIILCLQCNEPEERQRFLLPLLIGFQKYDSDFPLKDDSLNDFQICLQGSLVAQAVLKFHKPFRIVQSIINMPPPAIEFLAGHLQGCHVLNAFFGSISVGEKNKEKVLNNIKSSMLSIASDRNKSHTLSRIWTLLSMKLKEVIARELAENRNMLVKSQSGYAIFKKFGIHYFKDLHAWRKIQTNAPYNKNVKNI